MWVMLQTLSSDVPKYRDRISSPGNNVFIFNKPLSGLNSLFKQFNSVKLSFIWEFEVPMAYGELWLLLSYLQVSKVKLGVTQVVCL